MEERQGGRTQRELASPDAQGTQKRRRVMTRKGFAYLPGNSVSEVGERIKGGAVKEDKSPENEAILTNVQGVSENGRGIRRGLEPTISGKRSKIHVGWLGRPKCAEGGGGEVNQVCVNPDWTPDSRIARQALTSPTCSLEGVGVEVPDMFSSADLGLESERDGVCGE